MTLLKKYYLYLILTILFSSCFGFINAISSLNDCCSVILQVDNNTTAYGFRRDGESNATLRISKVKFGDKSAIVQKKVEDGYFAHVTIFEDGWVVSIGGAGDRVLNKRFQELGYNIIKNGSISSEDMEIALDMLRNGYLQYSILGLSSNRGSIPAPFMDKYFNFSNENAMGHFVVKAPDGSCGVCIYNEGQAF